MRHIIKLQKDGGRYKIHFPKLLIDEVDFKKVDYLILEPVGKTQIMIRRFIDGEHTKRQENIIGDG